MLNTENRTPEGKTLQDDSLVSFETKEENLHYPGVIDVDPKEVAKILNRVCLIDVRQPEEFNGELGHIPGARLVVLDTIADHLDEIPKDKVVVFVCRSGGRSARAAAFALTQNYKDVYNLKGGMLLWNDLHLPTEI